MYANFWRVYFMTPFVLFISKYMGTFHSLNLIWWFFNNRRKQIILAVFIENFLIPLHYL